MLGPISISSLLSQTLSTTLSSSSSDSASVITVQEALGN